ncbi:metallophosphoesterase [Marinobacter salinisoli]|uniref:Metallophosphoesterase n=1 Tax=Marinobacter salinisoli TaxID=2769486 RepID=A0ABX7MRI6_9GAMM|nr:metallophosphoesterase [Marinobacter salinisoli]QSP94004.1 metallophosphoesterase [Marinobacter salinisoli]
MKILDFELTPFHELDYRSSGPGGVERRSVLPFYRAWVDTLPESVQCMVAMSDIQGRELDQERNRLLGEAIADDLELLEDLGEIPRVGGVLLSGDLFDYEDCRKLGGTGDVTSVWKAFSSFAPKVVGVHGNHDLIAQELPNNALALDGQIDVFAGLKIGGLSGIIGREDRHQRRSEASFAKHLTNLLAQSPEILLLHQGPDDPARGQPGSHIVREVLERHGSSLIIFGHKHWSDPLGQAGEHQLLNVDHRVILLCPR